MPDNTPIEVWLLGTFLASCFGLGFVAGYIARRHGWRAWTVGLGSTSVALLWPIVVLSAFLVTTGPCVPQSASDPCDGPAMLFVAIATVVMPLLFIIGFVFALSGGIIAWLRFRPDAATEQALGADSS